MSMLRAGFRARSSKPRKFYAPTVIDLDDISGDVRIYE
jgi:hypothetical protein